MGKPVGIKVVDSDPVAFAILRDAVDGIFANSVASNFFGAWSFGGVASANPLNVPDRVIVANNARSDADGQQDVYSAIAPENISDSAVALTGVGGDGTRGLVNIYSGTSSLNSSYVASGYNDVVDGTRYKPSLSETLFHEMFHALSIPGMSRQTTTSDFMYQEQIAVFATNAVYNKQHGGHERMGHTAGDTFGSSLAQTTYINPNWTIGFNWNGANAVFRTEDHSGAMLGGSESSYTERTYHRNVAIDGDQIRNYVTVERYVSTGSIIGGSAIDQITSQLSSQSILYGGASQYGIAKSYGIQAVQMASQISSLLDTRTHLNSISYDQSRTVLVAVERFTDYRSTLPKDGSMTYSDWTGPAKASDGSALGKFYIFDQASSVGAILLGGSGFDQSRVDLADGVDIIRAGNGNDLIVVGGGSNGNSFNEAYGGGGDDILVGGIYKDHLFGGAGDDVLIGRGGGDILDGGADFDVVSYRGMSDGIDIDLTNVIQTGTGAASGDSLIGIEAVFGTDHDDWFKGAGNSTFFGEAGSDEFHLGSGDSGFGGSSDDLFFLEGNGARASGGDQDDVFILKTAGSFVIDGGDGTDGINASELVGVAVVYDIAAKTMKIGTAAAFDVSTVEVFDLSNTSYRIMGDVGDNVLHGWNHASNVHGLLFGGVGNDTLNGGHGDTLSGGAGNDIFNLMPGDFAIGGTGSDTFHITTSMTGVIRISDMKPEDILIIDGVRYQGRTTEALSTPDQYYSYEMYEPYYSMAWHFKDVITNVSSYDTSTVQKDYLVRVDARGSVMGNLTSGLWNEVEIGGKSESFVYDQAKDVGVLKLKNGQNEIDIVFDHMSQTGISYQASITPALTSPGDVPHVYGSFDHSDWIKGYVDSMSGLHGSANAFIQPFVDYII